MDNQNYQTGGNYGFLFGKQQDSSNDTNPSGRNGKSVDRRDDDLIIEDNTVYEIDRDCFERLKKQKKRQI